MKVAIIGAGNVGAACAQRIVEANLADVVLLDTLKDRGIQYVCLQTGDAPETILGYYAVPTVEDRLKVADQVQMYGRE